MTPEEALSSGFYRWLEQVAGGATPVSHVSPGMQISPFGTSLRVTKQLSASLSDAEVGGLVRGGRKEDQRISDLRTIGLLERDQPTRLSSLGREVLDRWRRSGVANELDEHEIVRCAILNKSGLAVRAEPYLTHLRFWLELRGLRPAMHWFQDAGNLVLMTYLNRTDAYGYNPFRVFCGIGAGFPEYSEWTAWAATMSAPPGWSQSRLGHVLQRVDQFERRSRGIVTYCRAMEAICLAVEDPRTLAHTVRGLVGA